MYPITLSLALAGILALSSLLAAPVEAGTISILSWRCVEEGPQIVVRGDIRNDLSSARNPVVVAVFKSIKEETITHSKGFAVFSPLPGGKTSPIELGTKYRRDIANCELTLQDPQSGEIFATVTQALPYDLPDGLGDAEKGQRIFNGKGICIGCHGIKGQINETPEESRVLLSQLNPKPSDLRNPKALKLMSDKQRFRAVKYGLPGTAMVSMGHISDEEIIDVLAYLRTLREASK